MNKYMDKSKAKQTVAPQQPKATQVSVSQQPKPSPRQTHNISRPKPAAATPTHEDIAKRAYEIYTRKGGGQGQSEQDWLQAEQELKNKELVTSL